MLVIHSFAYRTCSVLIQLIAEKALQTNKIEYISYEYDCGLIFACQCLCYIITDLHKFLFKFKMKSKQLDFNVKSSAILNDLRSLSNNIINDKLNILIAICINDNNIIEMGMINNDGNNVENTLNHGKKKELHSPFHCIWIYFLT